MSQPFKARQAPTTTVGAPPGASPRIAALAAQNSDLASAVHVAQRMLATYAAVDYDDLGALSQAHGAVRESLRILLRALGSNPDQQPVSTGVDAVRCPAAHPEDPTPCGGPVAVTVLDASNAGADGCEHHAARLLASLDGGRVYPLPDAPDGAALRTFQTADTLRPFPWLTNAPRTRDEELSRAEVRDRGDRP